VEFGSYGLYDLKDKYLRWGIGGNNQREDFIS
jgi:hypothetical protein